MVHWKSSWSNFQAIGTALGIFDIIYLIVILIITAIKKISRLKNGNMNIILSFPFKKILLHHII